MFVWFVVVCCFPYFSLVLVVLKLDTGQSYMIIFMYQYKITDLPEVAPF